MMWSRVRLLIQIHKLLSNKTVTFPEEQTNEKLQETINRISGSDRRLKMKRTKLKKTCRRISKLTILKSSVLHLGQ